MKNENKLQKLAEKYLANNKVKWVRIPDSVYQMLNNRRLPVPDFVRYAALKILSGIPDLILLFKSGRYLCIELKSDTGTQRPKQILFQAAVGDDNYKVIRDMKTLREVVSPYIKEDKPNKEDVNVSSNK